MNNSKIKLKQLFCDHYYPTYRHLYYKDTKSYVFVYKCMKCGYIMVVEKPQEEIEKHLINNATIKDFREGND